MSSTTDRFHLIGRNLTVKTAREFLFPFMAAPVGTTLQYAVCREILNQRTPVCGHAFKVNQWNDPSVPRHDFILILDDGHKNDVLEHYEEVDAYLVMYWAKEDQEQNLGEWQYAPVSLVQIYSNQGKSFSGEVDEKPVTVWVPV